MPRTTRAAARAKDAEIDIATDSTRTEALEHTAEIQSHAERPALVEMTANAIEEVELAIALKDETRSPKKASMSSARKANTKCDKTMAKGKKTAKNARVAQSAEPIRREAGHANERAEDSEGKGSKSDISEGVKEHDSDESSIATLAQEVQTEETQPQTEAVTKLEGLFEQPVKVEAANPVEEIAVAATVASSTLPDVAESSPSETKSTVSAPKTQLKPCVSGTPMSTVKAIKDRKHSLAARRPSAIMKKPVSKSSSTTTATGDKSKAVKTTSGSKSPFKEASTISKKPATITSLKTPPRLAKSTKAPTTSTFKLTGEGLSEKFKAQREERQKRQQEQAEKQKTTVSRPTIPPKHTTKPRAVPEIKLTKAASARMSMSNTLKERPNGAKPAVSKPASTYRLAHRPSLSASSGNTTKPARISTHARATSVTLSKDIPQPTITMTAAQKQEAAKKARAEAAERGRAASKAWAERKKGAEAAKKLQTPAENDLESKENTDPARATAQTF